MSKKRFFIKHLEKGRFYIHSDGHGGHPALLYKKIDKKNEYHIIIFTSSPGPNRIKLKNSIQKEKVEHSYIHCFPSVVKRRNLGSKELTGLKIDKIDKSLIKVVQKKMTHRSETYVRIINNIKSKVNR